MKKIEYVIISLIMFLLYIIVQVNIFSNLTIFGIVPDLFIILSIYLAVFADDKILPNILIIVFGLIFDICYSEIIGLSALIGFLIVNITIEFCNKVSVETKIGMMLYVFIVTFLTEVFYGILHSVLSNSFYDLGYFALAILITSAYNFVLTLFIHPIFSKSLKEKNSETRVFRKY